MKKLSLVAVGALSLSCAAMGIKVERGPEAPDRWSGLRSPDCEKQFNGQPVVQSGEAWIHGKQSAEQQILGLSCASAVASDDSGLQLEQAITAVHFDFDDRHFDHVGAARMLVVCAAPGTSHGGSKSFCEANPIGLGMLQWYAARLDVTQLAPALRAMGLSNEVNVRFTERATEAKKRVLAWAPTLDARRKALYVDVPDKVRADRQAMFQKNAAGFAQLDGYKSQVAALRPGSTMPAGLSEGLVKLRDGYFAQCADPSCALDPFVAETTSQLVLAHALTGQPFQARLEWNLISGEQANVRGYGASIWLAQRRAMEAEEKAFRDRQDAVSAGMDARLVDQTFGTPPPIQITPEASWRAPVAFESLGAAVNALAKESDAKLEFASGEVKSVERTGTQAKVNFSDIVSVSEEMRCRGTNRIASVDYQHSFSGTVSAKVNYENVCEGTGKKTTERKKILPVVLPATEVTGVVAGDRLEAFVTGAKREGGVLTVDRKGKLVQLRGGRIGGGAK